jgi:hypothetical protein
LKAVSFFIIVQAITRILATWQVLTGSDEATLDYVAG